MKVFDFHSHAADAPVVTLTPELYAANATRPCTVGIHPWLTASATPADLDTLRRAALDPAVAAIGEIGLDRLRGAEMPVQEEILEAQLRIASEAGKPVVLHIVRAFDRLEAVRKRLGQAMPVAAIHAFRGNVALARQLTATGLLLSIGPNFNAEAVRTIPDTKLLIETDTEASLPEGNPDAVLQAVAQARGNEIEALATTVNANFKHFYGLAVAKL